MKWFKLKWNGLKYDYMLCLNFKSFDSEIVIEDVDWKLIAAYINVEESRMVRIAFLALGFEIRRGWEPL